MRLRLLAVLLTALGLSAPASAINISIAGLTAEGLGRCGFSYNGTDFLPCSTTTPQEPEIDGDPASLGFGLMFDWYIMDPFSMSGADAPFNFTQLGHFGAGRTGAVDAVPAFYEFDLLPRLVTLTQGAESVSILVVQHAHLEIGMFMDTLTVDGIGPIVFDFATAGDLQLTLGTCTITAEGDPPCDIPGLVTEVPGGPTGQQVPAPSGLSLFGAALASLMGAVVLGNRRRKLVPARIKG